MKKLASLLTDKRLTDLCPPMINSRKELFCEFVLQTLQPGADLGGGWGGCFPPTSLKVTISAVKSASISKN